VNKLTRKALVVSAAAGTLLVSGCSSQVDTRVPFHDRVYSAQQLGEIADNVDIDLALHGKDDVSSEAIHAPKKLLPPGETITGAACSNYVKREQALISSPEYQRLAFAYVNAQDFYYTVGTVPNSRKQPQPNLISGPLGIAASCDGAMITNKGSTYTVNYRTLSIHTDADSTVAVLRTENGGDAGNPDSEIRVEAVAGNLVISVDGFADRGVKPFEQVVNAAVEEAKATGH
jgi:hypothetical protein